MSTADKKLYWDISKLHNWAKNPKFVEPTDLERLKTQIQELGQYKPLIVSTEGEVLGGNQRLKAYKELGITEVWVSVVSPKNEAQKLAYALSDNDEVGQYDREKLIPLIENVPDLDLEQYSVNLGTPIKLQDLIFDVDPDSLGDDFNLPSGDKSEFEQITFTLHKEQAQFIKDMLKSVTVFAEDYGNENKNGNAIFTIVKEWANNVG